MKAVIDRGGSMKATQLLAAVALVVTCAWTPRVASAQEPALKRIDLSRNDMGIPGREALQVIVEIAPGVTSPRHTHPGEEIIYILEGELEYTVEGKPPVILKAGDVLFVPARTVHAARNVGRGRGAELATYIVEKGKPLVAVVERHRIHLLM
jgi:quercetin dioxygenase-like cupin family protein